MNKTTSTLMIQTLYSLSSILLYEIDYLLLYEINYFQTILPVSQVWLVRYFSE